MSNKKENLKSTHTESSNDSSILTCPTCKSVDYWEDDFLCHCNQCLSSFSSRTGKIYKSHSLDVIKRSFAEPIQRSVAMFVRLGCVKIVPSAKTIKCQCCKKKHSGEQLPCPFILEITEEKCYCNCCSECYNECADSV